MVNGGKYEMRIEMEGGEEGSEGGGRGRGVKGEGGGGRRGREEGRRGREGGGTRKLPGDFPLLTHVIFWTKYCGCNVNNYI